MINSQELLSISKSIFKPQCLKFVPIWLQAASRNERKGLKIIAAIAKHKGTKHFRMQQREGKVSLEKAAREIERLAMQSSYAAEFSRATERYHESEVLKYKKFNELQYTEVLLEGVKTAINEWLKLDDDASFKDLMILCLQGLHSVCKINENMPVTSNQESFHWFTPGERMNGLMKSFRPEQNTPVIRSKRKTQSVTLEIQKMPARVVEPREFLERMKKKMRGRGDLMNWVTESRGSSYQNDFIGRKSAEPTQKIKGNNFSSIMRLMPI